MWALQGFVSNSTPLYCNAENLVGIDGCFATILKIRSYNVFNTTILQALQSFVAFGCRYCNGAKWLH
jgi:hypothetical protein